MSCSTTNQEKQHNQHVDGSTMFWQTLQCTRIFCVKQAGWWPDGICLIVIPCVFSSINAGKRNRLPDSVSSMRPQTAAEILCRAVAQYRHEAVCQMFPASIPPTRADMHANRGFACCRVIWERSTIVGPVLDLPRGPDSATSTAPGSTQEHLLLACQSLVQSAAHKQ